MLKLSGKKRVRKSGKSTYHKKALFRGISWISIILAVMAGSVMVGGFMYVPKSKRVPITNEYITIPDPNCTGDNLHLCTFIVVTITPTPEPESTQEENPDKGGDGKSGKDGGGEKNGKDGGNGGKSCFIKGTKILMADMTEKNIENVLPSDQVMGFDGKGLSVQTVTETEAPIRDHYYKVKLSDGTVLGMTDDHAVYTENGWGAINPENARVESPQLTVSDLGVGDRVLKSNGKFVPIISIKYLPGNVQTYNLKGVTGYNNYYANGVVAHNKGGGGNGGGNGGGGDGGGGGGGGAPPL